MGSIFTNDSPEEEQQSQDEYPFDPNLLPGIKKLLPKFGTKDKQIAYAEFLARKIKRHPGDLRAHTQRIYLNFILKNEEAYFGALVDLLITLGDRGLALKKSILGATYPLLNADHKSFIRQHLHSGISSNQSIPTRESRLSRGLSSTSTIIEESSGDPKETLLQSARKKLASGEIEMARALLENTLEEDPGDVEVADELLKLYRQHELSGMFTTMTTRLAGKTLAAREKWAETETYFSGS